MSNSAASYRALDDWIAREAIAFDANAPVSLNAAVDRVVVALDPLVEVLGLGEALHGGAEILTLRNRTFQRLVEAHGYTAIAIESSFPRGRAADEFVAGRGHESFDEIAESGFSHGFGRADANRELVEWMRRYNAEAADRPPLRFYGFDSPTEMMGADSPRQLLEFVLDYLAAIGVGASELHRQAIAPHLGEDAAWSDPAGMFDPAKSIGLSPAATALRLATEDLIADLSARRPELIAKSDGRRFREAVQHATLARQMLTYHATIAQPADDRLTKLLGVRDAMMADNLAYAAEQERGRGKVLAFAHNYHLKLGQAEWNFAGQRLVWSPAGAQLSATLGPRYAVIGSAVGALETSGIGPPEAGSLEARLSAASGPGRFIPTHRGAGLPASELATLPTRSGSATNSTYFPLTPRSVAEFDWFVALG